MCMRFCCNPQVNFCHFFCSFNLVILVNFAIMVEVFWTLSWSAFENMQQI